jgi:hypothetical protein
MSLLVSDVINSAHEDLGSIRPGETLSSAVQQSSFLVLQQRWATMSLEKAFTTAWYHQIFTLTAGVTAYTVGVGGSLTSTADPLGIIAWQSVSGNFKNGGSIMSFEQMENYAKDAIGSSSVLAAAVAADGAVPSKNIKVFPTPASSPGSLALDYWGVMTQFSAVTDVVNFGPGYADFLHNDLAIALYPRYARTGGQTLTALAANRQNALDIITRLNATILGLQAAPQPAA